MKAKYRISEDDYVNTLKLFGKLTPRIIVIYLAIAFALITFFLFCTSLSWVVAFGGLIGGLIGILFIQLIACPVMARRHYRKYKAIQDEFTVELVDGGVRISSPDADGKITWQKILKWRQNDKYVLIYPMPRIFYIVPKAVEDQGFDIQLLTSELLQHVGKPV